MATSVSIIVPFYGTAQSFSVIHLDHEKGYFSKLKWNMIKNYKKGGEFWDLKHVHEKT